jgi:hypothetical protein
MYQINLNNKENVLLQVLKVLMVHIIIDNL